MPLVVSPSTKLSIYAIPSSGPTFPYRTSNPEDDNGFHFGAFIDDQTTPTAVISLFLEPTPDDGDKAAAARFRKFACDPSFQGKGIGSQLLKYTFEHAKSELGVGVVWCDARLETAEWYERRGMRRFGEVLEGTG
ncbi:hypothetical protein AAF712_011953 [Marasmius tenuissimus]|uniref:N-acetyltransferase domain-containing protein n=1 Tax=Marasmius tenuissimus TaxID=585030 RepID=A0ABR2ZHW1_9AGAR